MIRARAAMDFSEALARQYGGRAPGADDVRTGPGALVRTPKLIGLASGGGHGVQLQRLRPAFADFATGYVDVRARREQVAGGYYVVPDASRFDLRSFAPVFFKAVAILIKERPKTLVTTGSAADAGVHPPGAADGRAHPLDRQHRQFRAPVLLSSRLAKKIRAPRGLAMAGGCRARRRGVLKAVI